MTDFPEALRAQLSARTTITRVEWEARPAAVLVPLFYADDDWHVLLTQRTNALTSHSGQVAFPGGRADPGDASPIETALRETEEEIGLPRERVTVIGQLDELLTVTQYRVTPIVGLIPWPTTFTPSPIEIDSIFGVPLRWLADTSNMTTTLREPLIAGPPIPVYHFYFGDYDIWGATARMLLNLLEVVAPLLSQSQAGR